MYSNITLPGLEGVIVTKAYQKEGIYHLHVELERQPHSCSKCHQMPQTVHNYRMQKIQHTQAFGRDTHLFYRKRCYICKEATCQKQFYEDNTLVARNQRQSVEFNQALSIELIHAKHF